MCPACSSWNKLWLYYKTGAAFYVVAGVDKDNRIIYSMVRALRKWHAGQMPRAAMCGECQASIPLWALKYNHYICWLNDIKD